MVDPTTANTSMSVPIRGTDVGTWDVPVNGNFNILDSMIGGVTTIALTSAAVTLTSSQGQNSVIRFTGTLNASVGVTLPSIYKGWTIDNQTTNSPSSFAIQIGSTGANSGIGVPPGVNDIFYDGTSVKFRNMGRLGEYWDYAGSVVPTWVGFCVTGVTVTAPWLNCNGAVISSATYPQLVNLLGTTTLPDLRGVARYSMNQGTGRLTTAGGGLDGNTIFATKTTETVTIGTSNLPPYTPSGTVTMVNGSSQVLHTSGAVTGGAGASFISADTIISLSATFTGSAQGGVSDGLPAIGTGTVFGITMIRTGL